MLNSDTLGTVAAPQFLYRKGWCKQFDLQREELGEVIRHQVFITCAICLFILREGA